MLDNQTILITGGTGFFGSNFVDYLLKNSNAKKIIIFSRDEFKQSEMKKRFGNDDRLRFFLGDVRDLSRLDRAFHGVDIVVHAAALKQVPTLEYNPFEAVKTNILGTQNVIEAAIDRGVKKVLLVSTDKAAQPVNLYGSTKLCAEKLTTNGNLYSDGSTKFSCVRYGNVIASRGSIVEILLKNRNQVKEFEITDEQMTRFWISLEQSIQLVLFALENMEGGEIFVPKIPSMKLLDLFQILVPDAKRNVIGIRPGEKVHELLVTKEESRHTYLVGNKYYVILPEYSNLFNMEVFNKYKEEGTQVSLNFSFTSDLNEEWLTEIELTKIIDTIIL